MTPTVHGRVRTRRVEREPHEAEIALPDRIGGTNGNRRTVNWRQMGGGERGHGMSRGQSKTRQ